MFWKTGMPSSADPIRPVAARWSIARRLALLYLLVVMGSYTVFGALFYAKRMKQLERESYADLAAERISVVAMAGEPDGRVLLGYELRTQQFEPETLRPFIRILDREGRTLLESRLSKGKVPPGAFPPPGAAALRWRNGAGDSFLLESSRLPGHLFSGPGALLQLGVNIHEEKELGDELRLTLIAFVCCGMLFAFGCAYLIIKLALKPLKDISLAASNITQHRLDTRIETTRLPAELVTLADSFNRMLGRLEDSFARLSHYSANLAHELRTPINTLMIESDIALAKERTPQQYRQVITSCLEECGRLSWTIDRLLFLARADLEAQDLVRQRLELRAEIEDVFDYFSDLACESGVSLVVHGSGVLHADQALLRRAISNLIENALHHTPSTGAIEVTLQQGGDLGTKITIRDTGCGIDAVHLPRIFDRFYRVASAATRQTGGAGLGLAIVKAIMQMHGGTVQMHSAPGEGTTVVLEFPAGVGCRDGMASGQ